MCEEERIMNTLHCLKQNGGDNRILTNPDNFNEAKYVQDQYRDIFKVMAEIEKVSSLKDSKNIFY